MPFGFPRPRVCAAVLSWIGCVVFASAQTTPTRTHDAVSSRNRAALPANSPQPKPNLFDKAALLLSREIREIDRRRRELDTEALTLPLLPRGQQGNRLGYHSLPSNTIDEAKWITMDLGRPVHIDSVVLVPADSPFDSFPGPGYGFPLRFRVELSENANFQKPLVIADHTAADFSNPGNYPVHLPAPGTTARYVRITATRLWSRANRGVFALGEVMVLSDTLNVAAGLPISAIQVADSREQFPPWTKGNLIDGQSVLGAPVEGPPSPSNGFQSEPSPRPDTPKWVQVDLGRVCDLQEVRIFPARPRSPSDPIPFGFPLELQVETSNDVDFREALPLGFSARAPAARPTASPVTIRAEGRRARFVRVTATWLARIGPGFSFALSELQVYSEGDNIAQGAPVMASDSIEGDLWSRHFLVDGYNSQQRLTEWPDWIRAMARRGEGERELGRLNVQRDQATYAMIESFVRWTSYFGVGLVLLAGLFIWRSHLARQRALEGLRTRIARDIHDEIGSGLGTIAMLSQMAQRQLDSGSPPKEDLEEIHRVARDLTESMRDIAWLNRADNNSLRDLHLRMRETAKTMLPSVSLDFPLEKRDGARHLSLEAKRQLFLIFKEAIHNILKHSKATRVAVRLASVNNRLLMSVQDNGRGFDANVENAGTGLSSMRERAEGLRGHLTVESRPGQGALVSVSVPMSG